LRDKQNAAKQQVAQLMMNMQEAQKARDFTAQQNSLSRSSSAGQASQNQRTAQIQALLGRGAQMNSGGREFVNAQSSQMGLGDLSGYMPNGWEPAYNPGWNQPEWQKQGIGEQFIDMNNPSSWNRASVSGGNGLDNMSAAELLRMYNGG